MRIILTIFVALITFSATNAQTVKLNSEGRAQDYVNTIMGRATKVTDALKITGTDKGTQVMNIVANRYFELNDIYEERDSLKAAAAKLTGDAKKQAQAFAESQKDSKLYRSHFAFDANLSLFLDAAEIEAVKDVMTYNVVKVTYDAQCDMIPTLKAEEKAQILAWLKEAREFAVDAESSKNEEWAKRVKARGDTL